MNRLLVINGHPNAESLCAGLAASYAAGARESGADVEVVHVGSLEFDADLHRGLLSDQPLEPDLRRLRASLVEADHVTVVSPVWWGSVPAALKGLLDRTLERGWAYRYTSNGMPEGLLAGRTGRVMITTDSPQWYLRGLMGDTTVRQLRRSTLKFCGLKPVEVSRFGSVQASTADDRLAWLDRATADGRRDGQRTPHAAKTNPPVPAKSH